ncbi:GNAT family N-acetyltransferase [Candidatus Saccharibacteria bacterium]|nr:GNAT family N-acetyltransferase [Candidatus Saccharibacteria bacterium]
MDYEKLGESPEENREWTEGWAELKGVEFAGEQKEAAGEENPAEGDRPIGEEKERLRGFEVRNLSPEDDLSRAGELLYMVDPFIFPDFLGDEERAKEFGPKLFNDKENGLFSYGRTLVAEDSDGKLEGILCYRTSEVEPWDSEVVTEKFKEAGAELPENFERANENYMKKITDAELPPKSAELEFVATAPEARGQGVATKMFEQLRDSGEFEQLHLDVLANNEGAINLYKKWGFEITDEFPCYPDGSVQVYHMILNLKKGEEAEQ